MEYTRKDKFTKPNTVKEILILALEKEKSSFDFYNQMIEGLENLNLLTVLTNLRDAEKGHIQIIEHMLNK